MISFLGLGLHQPQHFENTVIYEVNERAFSRSGDFSGIAARLDDIKRLGVTTIWLMPINPVGKLKSAGGLGSPYAVQNYTQVNPEFGTMGDFHHLVDQIHAKGMKVVIDWVADHTSWDNPWISHKDWYQQDTQGNITIPKGTNYLDIAGLNYDNPEMRKAMIRAMQFWVKEADIDGFRCDYANAVPSSFWKEAITGIRSHSTKPLLFLAEGDKPDLIPSGFDMTYDWISYGLTKDLFHSKVDPKSFALDPNDYAKEASRESKTFLRFVTNHDEAAWNGSVVDQFNGEDAAFGAFLVGCLSGGTPLIYDGQEIGWPQKIPFFDRSEIDWNSGASIKHKFERVMNLYRGVTGDAGHYYSSQAVILSRPCGNKLFWIVTNPLNQAINVNLPYVIGPVHDVVSDQNMALTDHVRLNPYQSLVFLSPQTE